MTLLISAIKRNVYRCIELLTYIPWVNTRLKHLSKYYILFHSGFSYDMKKNGERQVLSHLYKNVAHKSLVFFDVGANKGSWTKMAIETAPGAHIHCFEPCPETFCILSQTLGGSKNITLNQMGLSDTITTLKMNNFGNGSGQNSFVADPSFTGQARQFDTVPVVTAKNYIDQHAIPHIDFMKIDVEGWEYFVLVGLHDYLRPDFVRLIQFEYGYAHGDSKTLMKDFYTLLQSHGYKIGKLRRNGVVFSDFVYHLNDFDSGPNFIACHPDDVIHLSKFN